MPFNNPIVGTGFGTLLRTSIRSLVQTTTLGWSINTDGTATFITVSATALRGQILELSGLQAVTTWTYWLFDTPFGNGVILTWDSTANGFWTLSIPPIVGNPQPFNFTDGVGNAAVLQNGGRPVYYSKPTLPDLVTSTATAGPTAGAATLTVITSNALTLDGTTRIKVEFDCARIDTTVGGDTFTFTITDNGTAVRTFRYQGKPGADDGDHIAWTSDTAPSAGVHTYALTVVRTAGGGTLAVNGSALGMFQLVVSEFL